MKTPPSPEPDSLTRSGGSGRIASIDALRGFVMFVMIIVNDLSPVPADIVPWWMKHFHGPTGLTFVDLVFPGFLFIVGMSIPFALQSRLKKEPRWRTFLHVISRTLALLFIGVLMVNDTPDTARMGWSGPLWCTLMYLSAICAFCVLTPAKPGKTSRFVSLFLRCLGLTALVILALVFRSDNGRSVIGLSPFYIRHMWWGILGYIAWAYLLSGIIFLIFGTNLTALLGCAILMMCMYPANKNSMFSGLWLAGQVNFGVAFGSRAAITALGLMLGVRLLATGPRDAGARIRFALWLTVGCAVAAWLLSGLYGVSKEEATPSWALWGCVTTAALWLIFYFIADLKPLPVISKPLAVAGENVFLAYLISEMLPYAVDSLGISHWYEGLAQPHLANALLRSAVCSVVILVVSAGLNRLGFRLKL